MSWSNHHLGSLYGPVDSHVHRVAASVKLLCLLGFLFAVVATPQRAVPAFGAYAVLVVGAVALARIPMAVMLRRLTIEVPFVLFAVALPFIGGPPHHLFGWVTLSDPGLWTAWAIIAKATLGTAATVVLAWSTPVAEILVALERLRVPRAFTAIAGFMIRYMEIVTFELDRLQVARVSRGDNPRWFWQARAVGATVGALFVRSFERGERVHQAMISRGFTGAFPSGAFPSGATTTVQAQWFPALIWPLAAWCVAAWAILS